jgi:head-tail adaptor
MADLLATGAAWLASAMKAYAGRSVVYRRENGAEATLTSVAGQSVNGDPEQMTVERVADELIVTADFETAFGDGVRPAVGDEIEVDADDVRRVVPFCWRESDPQGVRMRVHTERRSDRTQTVTFQRPTETPNDFGEPVATHADLGTYEAKVVGRGGRETQVANQTVPEADYLVFVLPDDVTKALRVTDRVVWAGPGGDVTLGIVHVDLSRVPQGEVVVYAEAGQ